MNHVVFLYIEIDPKKKNNNDKTYTCWFGRLIVVSKRVMSVVDIDKN